MGPSRTTSRSSSRRLMSQKLLRVSPEEFDILSDPQLDSDSTDFYDAAPMDLEQPWPYRFEVRHIFPLSFLHLYNKTSQTNTSG